MRAIGYARVSTVEQVRLGVSLADQQERIESYCTAAGLELATVIVEEGVSASKALGCRPGGAEMLRMVKAKQVQAIVAIKLDRLFRSTTDCLGMTKDWEKAGVALHLLDMGGQSIDTSSALGRFFMTTLAGIAELERGLTSERVTAAAAHKRKHREPYGPVAYGYKRTGNKLVAVPEELRNIRRMRELRQRGVSFRQIAAQLNLEGANTKRNGRWTGGGVQYVLANELYEHEEVAACDS